MGLFRQDVSKVVSAFRQSYYACVFVGEKCGWADGVRLPVPGVGLGGSEEGD